jgi:hypothetical protein
MLLWDCAGKCDFLVCLNKCDVDWLRFTSGWVYCYLHCAAYIEHISSRTKNIENCYKNPTFFSLMQPYDVSNLKNVHIWWFDSSACLKVNNYQFEDLHFVTFYSMNNLAYMRVKSEDCRPTLVRIFAIEQDLLPC